MAHGDDEVPGAPPRGAKDLPRPLSAPTESGKTVRRQWGSDDDRDGWRIHDGARLDPASGVRRTGEGGFLTTEDPPDEHHQSRAISRARGHHGYGRARAQRRPGGTGRQ